MAEPQRYVVVDPATKYIVGGPYLWDGVTLWNPPDEGTLMLESDAQAAGYIDKPPVVYTNPYVLVDDASRIIVGGPWDWDGQSDPPPAVIGDGQQLLVEVDALSQGYIYP